MKVKSFVIAGLVALLGIIGMSMKTDSIDVPEAVKNAFAKKFPNAEKVEWEMEEADEYEAEFKLKGEEMSANFKEDGTWVGTETEIDEDDLPKAVKGGIATSFPGFEVEEAELSEEPDGITSYELELENEKDDIELKAVFSADGKLIKKEMNEDEEDEDEGGN